MLNAKKRFVRRKLKSTSAFSFQYSHFADLLPRISHHGNVNEIVGKFGGPDKLRSVVDQLQELLYAPKAHTNMKDLLRKLFPTWFAWAGLVFTTAGLLYSALNNLPWVALIAALPLTFALLETALRQMGENRNLQAQLAQESSLRTDVERKLQEVSADSVIRLEHLVSRAVFQEYFELIYEFTAYVGRLQKLTRTSFDLREVFATSDSLYVAAKATPDALTQLRENDPFVLFAGRSGLNHPVAKLRLHQVNEQQQSIFLEIVEELDKPTISSLRILAQGTSARGLKDYGMRPDVNTDEFKNEDMHAVTHALAILRGSLLKS